MDKSPPRYTRGATNHGTKRVRQRLKLPARAVRRLVAAAKADGLHEDQMPTWLKAIVRHKKTLHPEGSQYVYYRDNLFIFSHDTGDLITVFPVGVNEPDLDRPDWDRIRSARLFT